MRRTQETSYDWLITPMTPHVVNSMSGELFLTTWTWTFPGSRYCTRSQDGLKKESSHLLYVRWRTSGRTNMGSRDVSS